MAIFGFVVMVASAHIKYNVNKIILSIVSPGLVVCHVNTAVQNRNSRIKRMSNIYSNKKQFQS